MMFLAKILQRPTRAALAPIVCATLSIALVGCVQDQTDQNADPATLVQRVMHAMEKAGSYHVVVVSLAPATGTTIREVDADFQSPNQFHTLSVEGGVTNEQIWAEVIFVRDCRNGQCEQWKRIPRPDAPTDSVLGEQVPGFPMLPMIALAHLASVKVNETSADIKITGDFHITGSLGTNEIANPRFEITVDPDTYLVSRADIHSSDVGDLRYEYSEFANVQVK